MYLTVNILSSDLCRPFRKVGPTAQVGECLSLLLTGFLYVCNSSFILECVCLVQGSNTRLASLLGAFALSQKASITFIMPVCVYACISAASTGGIFVKFIRGLMKISRGENPNLSKTWQKYHFT